MEQAVQKTERPLRIRLNEPVLKGNISLEQALNRRRSIRLYNNELIELADVGQLLWAGHGLTYSGRHLTVPSAGGVYPLRLYLISSSVSGLQPGVYKYLSNQHELESVSYGDFLDKISESCNKQSWIASAGGVIVIAANFPKMMAKYGMKGELFAYMESGHAAQNILLQAVSLHLGSVIVGAFDNNDIWKTIGRPANENVIAVIPFGKSLQ